MLAEEKVKLPRSSFDELCKIISVYGQFDQPVTLTVLSKTAGLTKETISANAKFLLAIGVIEGGQKKQATVKGRKLAKAIDHQMPDEQRRHWREIVSSADFLARLVTAVRIRKGMDEETFKSHIAYSAGEPNKGYVMTGARAVIDLLRAAELIREEDGKLTAVDIKTVDASTGAENDDTQPREEDSVPRRPAAQASTGTASQVLGTSTADGVSVSIRVNVECTPGDLDDLGAKLRRVVDDLRKKVNAGETNKDDTKGES